MRSAWHFSPTILHLFVLYTRVMPQDTDQCFKFALIRAQTDEWVQLSGDLKHCGYIYFSLTCMSVCVSQPIRYSSAKRPRSKEERTAFVVGVPVYTLERMDTRIKKVQLTNIVCTVVKYFMILMLCVITRFILGCEYFCCDDNFLFPFSVCFPHKIMYLHF